MFAETCDEMSPALISSFSLYIRRQGGKFVRGDPNLPAVAMGDAYDFLRGPPFIARAEWACIKIFRTVFLVLYLSEFFGPFGALGQYYDPFPGYQIKS
jgi:hypothetical protein